MGYFSKYLKGNGILGPLLPGPHCHIDEINTQGWFKVKKHYLIPIHDTSFELSVFWPSDIESPINKVNFSDTVSQSFKKRLTLTT